MAAGQKKVPLVPVYPILLYSRKSRTGKDYTAKWIKKWCELASLDEDYGVQFNCEIYHFAKYLKELAYELFKDIGVKQPYLYDFAPNLRSEVLENGMTVVEVWIALGECCRGIYQGVWSSRCFGDIVAKAKTYDLHHYPAAGLHRPQVFVPVIADMRFDNEFDYFSQKTQQPMFIEIEDAHGGGVVNGSDNKLTRKVHKTLLNDKTPNYQKILTEFGQGFCRSIKSRVVKEV